MLSGSSLSPRKAIIVTYSVFVSIASIIEHGKLKCHIILSPTACLPLPNFTAISHKDNVFRKGVREYEMWVLIFSTFARNISHSENNWERWDTKCVSVFMSSAGYFCQFVVKVEQSRHIFRKSSNSKFQENLSSGSQTYVQVDMRR